MEEMNVPVQKETNSIKLNRGMKGVYGWEIKLAGDDEKEVLKRIKDTDDELRKTYIELNSEGSPHG